MSQKAADETLERIVPPALPDVSALWRACEERYSSYPAYPFYPSRSDVLSSGRRACRSEFRPDYGAKGSEKVAEKVHETTEEGTKEGDEELEETTPDSPLMECLHAAPLTGAAPAVRHGSALIRQGLEFRNLAECIAAIEGKLRATH